LTGQTRTFALKEAIGIVERVAASFAELSRGAVRSPISNRVERFFREYRIARIRLSLKQCGTNLSIQFPTLIAQPEQIEIGNDVSIVAFVHIWGAGGVRIGNRTMIGSHGAISSVTHDYTRQEMNRTIVKAPVEIGDDVWLGSHVMVMPGVVIGSGAVVGAGALVTKNVAPRAIVAGVPARVLKFREVNATGTAKI
jgi:maltose O-acetyltransferase